jgi:UDP-3-O-[3-hydroxymyristoyl] glucosamine N-acyltransferase
MERYSNISITRLKRAALPDFIKRLTTKEELEKGVHVRRSDGKTGILRESGEAAKGIPMGDWIFVPDDGTPPELARFDAPLYLAGNDSPSSEKYQPLESPSQPQQAQPQQAQPQKTQQGKLHPFRNAKPAPAHQHPNGGGWVADTARVDLSVFVGPNAEVFGQAQVFSGRIDGDAQVSGNASIRISNIEGNATVIGNATVASATIIDGHISGGWISNCFIAGGRIGGDVEITGGSIYDGNIFGNVKISDNAQVSGGSVFGEAKISDLAIVSDNATVSGEAKVSGEARVAGNAKVYENAEVSGNAWIGFDPSAGRAGKSVYSQPPVRISGNAVINGGTYINGEQINSGTHP